MANEDRTPLDPASPGRSGGVGQSAGGAYPNKAGAGKPFEGGQSGRGYYGGDAGHDQLGGTGPETENATARGDSDDPSEHN